MRRIPKLNLDKLKKIKSHTFKGNKYKICVAKLPKDTNGLCESPETKGKTVYISEDIRDEKELLECIVDELIHAAVSFDLDNDVVDVMSNDMAGFLWRAGYRRVDS